MIESIIHAGFSRAPLPHPHGVPMITVCEAIGMDIEKHPIPIVYFFPLQHFVDGPSQRRTKLHPEVCSFRHVPSPSQNSLKVSFVNAQRTTSTIDKGEQVKCKWLQ